MTLLAAFNFDEASGNALDVTGNGHDFPVSGNTTRVTGHTGSGLSQSANTTTVGPAPTGLQTTSRTWMAWIKFSAAISGWIIEFHNTSAGTGVWGLLDISGTLRFRAKNSSNTVFESTSISRDIGNWQHIAATHDGANLKVYINGTLLSTTAMAFAIWTADVINMLDQSGSSVVIDDVRFHDQALDAATISSLMSSPVTSGSSFSGSVALAGSGTVSNAGKPAIPGGTALSGSGTLANVGQPAGSGSLGLAGSGELAPAGTPAVPGTAALAGTGALTETGAPAFTGSAALSGAGSLTAAGQPALPGALPLFGGGTLLGTAGNDYSGTAAFTGSGAIGLNGKPAIQGDLNLAGAGSLTAAGPAAYFGTVHLSGTGKLAKASSFGPAVQSVLTATNAASSGLTPRPPSDLTPSNAPSSQLEVTHVV